MRRQTTFVVNGRKRVNALLQAASRRDNFFHLLINFLTGPRSAVGNVSGYRCLSDCRSRDREFHSDPVPYFRGN